jgi:glutamate-1-semialdehyde aminotransferase
MGLPVNASVEATPNFLAGLQTAHAFFVQQDTDTAPKRLSKLKAELREMTTILGWSPACGRPARFLTAKSAQARLRNASVAALAQEAGLPSLREYLLDQHIILYAHSNTEVVLLALKHQRQLGYSLN